MSLFASMKNLTPAERKVSNRVTGFVTGLMGATAIGLASTAGAAPTTNSVSDHVQLVEALENAGVTVVLNSPQFCDPNTSGLYASYQRFIVICQENAEDPYRDQGWTAYDLDTLRHEAHHVVQDCIAGGLADNNFGNLFDGDEFEEFVRGSLTAGEIDWIITNYGSQGQEVILNELEAFATAKVIGPETISEVITEVCKFKF